ncbi:sel1 repeat family protein [Paraburkholderia graminis]|uniref:SEL1-like repeat protein n=1 Tax=Paraburkholderia graminis TaxID=60548 RepID=UPI0038B744CE
MTRRRLLVLLLTVLCACTHKENTLASLPDMSAVRANLAFTCVHEVDHLPPLDQQADALFSYGRYLQKQDGPKDFNAVARYYRIAAAYGHYKANHNLQLLVSQGLADSPDAPKETVDLAARLVQKGVPGGYFDIGHYLEIGYGLKLDSEMALRYFRKAADLGSPEAQSYVGDLLAPLDKAPAIAKQMRECATDQGFSDAATTLGADSISKKLYPEAVKAFQAGIAAGNTQSASFLKNAFDTEPSDALYYVGLQKDSERSSRYELIWEFLNSNDGRNPKVPDIDQIVPLPPAKLPPWDGTFLWQKEQDAAQPPQKPAEALVTKLAREKNLDPATGLPIAPAKSAKDERVPLGTVARTGQVCPQDGLWTVQRFSDVSCDAPRRFTISACCSQIRRNTSA